MTESLHAKHNSHSVQGAIIDSPTKPFEGINADENYVHNKAQLIIIDEQT